MPFQHCLSVTLLTGSGTIASGDRGLLLQSDDGRRAVVRLRQTQIESGHHIVDGGPVPVFFVVFWHLDGEVRLFVAGQSPVTLIANTLLDAKQVADINEQSCFQRPRSCDLMGAEATRGQAPAVPEPVRRV